MSHFKCELGFKDDLNLYLKSIVSCELGTSTSLHQTGQVEKNYGKAS
jgi:hypothetical protein